MKYNIEISETTRIEDQYLGFLDTRSARFWSNARVDMFQLPSTYRHSSDFRIQENTLLGKRAEAFFLKAISAQNRYEMLASQVQLIESGITLGELDFILKDKTTNQCIHVELSYKLYLFDLNSAPNLEHWVGPNKRDSLYKKWNKLRDSQLPNIYTAAGIEILKNLNLQPHEIQQAVCMPLQLFLPYGKRVEVDAEFHPCVEGEWMAFNTFHVKDWSGFAFFMPEKQDWFVHPEKCKNWFTKDEIISLLIEYLQSGISRMLWIKSPEDKRQKIFVTFWD